MSHLYTTRYYQHQKDGSYVSAEHIVPIVLEYYQPKSIIDIGCGVGNWLSVFQKHGVTKVKGIDGSYVDKSQLRIAPEFFEAADLVQPITETGTYDMAMTLEVAEHLPDASAAKFVEELTRLAPVVLFSAAVPYQGGTGHINEQWPQYWVTHFKNNGYVPIDPLRKRIWDNDAVEWWYAQNIMFFVKESRLSEFPKLQAAQAQTFQHQLALLHPRSLSLYTMKFAMWPLFKKKVASLFGKTSV